MIRITGIILFCIALQGGAEAMTIYVAPRTQIDNITQSPTSVYLDGDIDSASPALLSKTLASLRPQSVTIFLNSPGGNLLAGMELGRLLRKYGATTNIGKFSQGNAKATPGGCYSACTLTYLGGYFRYKDPQSEYGVHRFMNPSGPKSDDLDRAQILSAAIGNYINEMGVDRALFDLTTKASSSDIYILSTAELESLHVVNNGRMTPSWTIEAIEGGMYLKGVQDTQWGQGKAMFFCQNRQFSFYSIYAAGDRTDSISRGGWFHSLLIDGSVLKLSSLQSMKINDGYLNMVFDLTAKQFQQIAGVKKSIGHAIQVSYEAPTFVGYTVDTDSMSTQRIKSFITNCATNK